MTLTNSFKFQMPFNKNVHINDDDDWESHSLRRICLLFGWNSNCSFHARGEYRISVNQHHYHVHMKSQQIEKKKKNRSFSLHFFCWTFTMCELCLKQVYNDVSPWVLDYANRMKWLYLLFYLIIAILCELLRWSLDMFFLLSFFLCIQLNRGDRYSKIEVKKWKGKKNWLILTWALGDAK